jgi:hypothetical protein
MRLERPRRLHLLAALPLTLALACQDTTTSPSLVRAPEQPAFVSVPAEGSSTTLDFGTWNLEWFGDSNEGPSNETSCSAPTSTYGDSRRW